MNLGCRPDDPNHEKDKISEKSIPLAAKLRPRTLSDIAGQDELLRPDRMLYRMIKADKLMSIILYGPPGTGKTTIANVIANETNAKFERINAVSAGKKDIQAVCEKARDNGEKTILFIDEIHRFNKIQQDYLLPFVENGTVILIGATTENPYFEVNPALVSRSQIFVLQPLKVGAIQQLMIKGLHELGMEMQVEALTLLSEQANGDARFALSTLELASLCADERTDEGKPLITIENVKSVIQKPHLQYDKDGDKHYDTISAFIKSMRGSDPDAVLYYLARLIESGEDPKFIARRIIIAASEDVSNADPMALPIAVNASLAVERIGMPEGRIPLAQAALYIAMAPKSNSAIIGIDKALDYIKKHPKSDIPPHLRDCHYSSAVKLGHGVDYQYPHDFPDHWCEQSYLPEHVTEYFYTNTHVGYEKTQADYQNNIRNKPR